MVEFSNNTKVSEMTEALISRYKLMLDCGKITPRNLYTTYLEALDDYTVHGRETKKLNNLLYGRVIEAKRKLSGLFYDSYIEDPQSINVYAIRANKFPSFLTGCDFKIEQLSLRKKKKINKLDSIKLFKRYFGSKHLLNNHTLDDCVKIIDKHLSSFYEVRPNLTQTFHFKIEVINDNLNMTVNGEPYFSWSEYISWSENNCATINSLGNIIKASGALLPYERDYSDFKLLDERLNQENLSDLDIVYLYTKTRFYPTDTVDNPLLFDYDWYLNEDLVEELDKIVQSSSLFRENISMQEHLLNFLAFMPTNVEDRVMYLRKYFRRLEKDCLFTPFPQDKEKSEEVVEKEVVTRPKQPVVLDLNKYETLYVEHYLDPIYKTFKSFLNNLSENIDMYADKLLSIPDKFDNEAYKFPIKHAMDILKISLEIYQKEYDVDNIEAYLQKFTEKDKLREAIRLFGSITVSPSRFNLFSIYLLGEDNFFDLLTHYIEDEIKREIPVKRQYEQILELIDYILYVFSPNSITSLRNIYLDKDYKLLPENGIFNVLNEYENLIDSTVDLNGKGTYFQMFLYFLGEGHKNNRFFARGQFFARHMKIKSFISGYIRRLIEQNDLPTFNAFYRYYNLAEIITPNFDNKKILQKFDIPSFIFNQIEDDNERMYSIDIYLRSNMSYLGSVLTVNPFDFNKNLYVSFPIVGKNTLDYKNSGRHIIRFGYKDINDIAFEHIMNRDKILTIFYDPQNCVFKDDELDANGFFQKNYITTNDYIYVFRTIKNDFGTPSYYDRRPYCGSVSMLVFLDNSLTSREVIDFVGTDCQSMFGRVKIDKAVIDDMMTNYIIAFN